MRHQDISELVLAKGLARVQVEQDKNDFGEALRILNETSSIAYAKKTAIKLSQKAKETLSILPNSGLKKILIELADYVVLRVK